MACGEGVAACTAGTVRRSVNAPSLGTLSGGRNKDPVPARPDSRGWKTSQNRRVAVDDKAVNIVL